MTPEQKLYALSSIISLAFLAIIAWQLLFDWIEDRFIGPWKERIRREMEDGD